MIKKMKQQQGPETSTEETKSVKDTSQEKKSDLNDNKVDSKADTNKVNTDTPEKKERKLPRQIDPPPEPKKPERFSPSMLRRRESKDKPMTIRYIVLF